MSCTNESKTNNSTDMSGIGRVNEQSRSLRGRIAAIVGIAVNILLALGKITVGSLFGLVSVTADGLNNLTDCGSSVVSLVSFKLSMKPADKEHPFGHQRVEYICSLTVAFLVLLVAFDTAKEAVGRIIEPVATEFSLLVVGVLVASIAAKLGLFLYYRHTARAINSSILTASAGDSLMDCVSTAVTLLCFVIGAITGACIDGYAGVFVALFIAWSAIGLLRDIFSNLIGRAPDEEMVEQIKDRILSHEGVLAVHDLTVYSYGPNKFFASAHIEVPSSVDVLISHELIDEIERDFVTNTNVMLTGHLDPIETDNSEVNSTRERVVQLVRDIDESFTIHDFRMVIGERRTNVLFDVAIPYGTRMPVDEIRRRTEEAVRGLDSRFFPVITVEHTMS